MGPFTVCRAQARLSGASGGLCRRCVAPAAGMPGLPVAATARRSDHGPGPGPLGPLAGQPASEHLESWVLTRMY